MEVRRLLKAYQSNRIRSTAAANPRPARICAGIPPNEWPITAGLAAYPHNADE